MSIKEENEITIKVICSNNKVIERHDNNTYKREKIAEIKTDLNELKRFLIEITDNENNHELTESEKEKVFKQNCYRIYRITTNEKKDYYIKDVNQVKYLKELLN